MLLWPPLPQAWEWPYVWWLWSGKGQAPNTSFGLAWIKSPALKPFWPPALNLLSCPWSSTVTNWGRTHIASKTLSISMVVPMPFAPLSLQHLSLHQEWQMMFLQVLAFMEMALHPGKGLALRKPLSRLFLNVYRVALEWSFWNTL